MSEWKKVKLGELCDFINGGAWSDKEYAPEGIPVLKVTNCKNSGFSLSELSYLPYSLEQKYIQNKLQRNDVIIATVGSHPNLVNSSAGRSVIVNSFVEGFYLNQNAVCIRTKDEEILDQLFWGYYSKYYLFQNYIQMRGKGAANQMRIAISAIKDYPMPLPPINVQRHIATILSRYDSLIENYQKQIKLLEEAAQRLYKEWFIDLRFPGHENTNIIDGVPEGWEKKSITDVLEIKYGKDHKLLKEGTIPVYGTGGIMRYVEKSLFTGESVLIPRKGSLNNIMLVGGTFWTIDTMFYSIPKENNVAKIVYFYLKGVDMYSFNIGAAVPSMTVNILSGMKLLVPNEDVKNKFETIASKYFIRMHSLQSQLRLLTEARDRLLPKLMSGEIEI